MNSDNKESSLPPGVTLIHTLSGHQDRIRRIAWSPDGKKLASGSSGKTIWLWDAEKGESIRTPLEEHSGTIYTVAWSSDGQVLASGSGDNTIGLWNTEYWYCFKTLKEHAGKVYKVAWSPDGKMLASASVDSTIRLWDTQTWECVRVLAGHNGMVFDVAWSPDGKRLASGASDHTVRIWNQAKGECDQKLEGHYDAVFSVAWLPDGQRLVTSASDHTIRVWDIEKARTKHILEGHKEAVIDICLSQNGHLLASKARDNTIGLWRCDTWDMVAILDESSSAYGIRGISFSPTDSTILATLGDEDKIVRIWKLDIKKLRRSRLRKISPRIQYASTKVVFVGESNVGKTCLAMRLAEDRYPGDEEQGTTHGMRFWRVEPESLGINIVLQSGQRCEIVFWDFGGQDEYRLVHQLFLPDATLALILLDPTRGRAAFEEVRTWNKYLEKQLGGHKSIKLLIGSKMDEESDIVDRAGIKQLCEECGFDKYYETSARTGRGIDDLREAIATIVDWDKLAIGSRPELFQHIQDEILQHQKNGEIVLLFSQLEQTLRRAFSEDKDLDKSINGVVEQLAKQGVILNVVLATRERYLVLQIAEIERYAGSLIVAARNNQTTIIPALEELNIASPDVVLPGIKSDDRLPRDQERIVLECVFQLLVEHGICLRHAGLLIFPSLFRVTEKNSPETFRHTASLYYDFTGAIDNIYASLVAWLVIVKKFGRVRLWEDRAEFFWPDKGFCGLHKIDRGGGFAHLDIYFDDKTPKDMRDIFTDFIDSHLHDHGVEIREHIYIKCPSCQHQFSEDVIYRRIREGYADIGCPACDARVSLRVEVEKSGLTSQLIALRTKVEQAVTGLFQQVIQIFKLPDESYSTENRSISILHLSDLHFNEGDDIKTKLRPLVADIKDKRSSLDFSKLDYLVVSGDISNFAKPKEFYKAYQFILKLIEAFGLSAQRCILVPGNHDLSWDESVYNWVPERKINRINEKYHVKKGDGYLIRKDNRYPYRFRNYSNYFYHPLTQSEYPLTFDQQGISLFFNDTGIQFLTFNSCFEIDEHFPNRSGIHGGALACALEKADEQIQNQHTPVLRIGIWHHPVTGKDSIENTAFLEQLRKADVRLILHGHVHEERPDLIGYPFRDTIYVTGAGSFGASANARPESTPRLYNLIEITRDFSSVKVHTRWLRRDQGAWEGWAIWPGDDSDTRRTYYTIKL